MNQRKLDLPTYSLANVSEKITATYPILTPSQRLDLFNLLCSIKTVQDSIDWLLEDAVSPSLTNLGIRKLYMALRQHRELLGSYMRRNFQKTYVEKSNSTKT